ncbi:MAG TPA: hypothetical protein O0X70_03830 [Methanocorpusculum sp.]|nr:hypothetical protein [Methanocorpusculum sp.]
MTETVTVSLSRDVLQKLDRLRDDDSTTYAEIVAKIIEDAVEDEEITPEERRELEELRAEVKAGIYYTAKEVDEMIALKSE